MYKSTKTIGLGSCAFRQPRAESHCRFLHGYQLTAKIWFRCEDLDENNWVVDFGGLKTLKANLLEKFDHQTVIAGDDPLLPHFRELHGKGGCQLQVMDNGVGVERFAELVCDVALNWVQKNRDYVRRNVLIDKVEVFEHANNSALYVNERLVNEVLPNGHPTDADRLADVPEVDEAGKIQHNEQEAILLIHDIKDGDQDTPTTTNAAPLYNVKTDMSQKSKPAPLRNEGRDKSLGEILAGN